MFQVSCDNVKKNKKQTNLEGDWTNILSITVCWSQIATAQRFLLVASCFTAVDSMTK